MMAIQHAARLNPALPAAALEDAFRKLTRPEGPTLEARNRAVHRLFVDGVTVEYRTQDGAIRGAQARVIDFADADNNDWLAVNQFTVSENKHTRRPDVALFVNGLPLALIELKNAADENATIWTAFQQLQPRSPRSSPSTICWSSPTASRRGSARLRRGGNGSSPGAPSRASAWQTRTCRSFRSCPLQVEAGAGGIGADQQLQATLGYLFLD
jgi:Type I restriction enzyme R protein N terminus (HSDR_N)